MNAYRIRFASQADASALLDIYRQYINLPVTFEEVCPAVSVFRERIKHISEKYPYLVCEHNGSPVGYAYAHEQHARAAYRWNAELSVYIHPEYTGKRIGNALYGALTELLQIQHFVNLYAYVTLPNERSEALHRAFGFALCGICRHTGFKAGQWHDVGIFEKKITDKAGVPQEPVPITALPAGQLDALLNKYSVMIKA